MKKSLQLCIGCMILLIPFNITMKGQTVVLSENFAGFTTGTHASPTTYDYGGSLDSRTMVPGWLGYKINSAAGEIKIGTEDVVGWIETPVIDLSSDEGKFKIRFDVCRWPGDAATVKVLLNGTAIGTTITPTDNFETVEISGTGGTSTSKIRIEGVTKRFYLDNFFVTVNSIATGLRHQEEIFADIKIFPVPVQNILNISNMQYVGKIEICDISGKVIMTVTNSVSEMHIEADGLSRGIYLIRFISSKGVQVRRFIKL